jgi:hypothetical protein
VVVVGVAGLLWRAQSERDEPAHRTSLPVWVKVPIILGVVVALLLMKEELRGFTTTFPLVGVLAAYEARHSLWTLSRGVARFLLAMTPALAVMRLVQSSLGLAGALAVVWIVFLCLLLPLTRDTWAGAREAGEKL